MESLAVVRALNDSLTPNRVERVVTMMWIVGTGLDDALDSGLLDWGIRMGDAFAAGKAEAHPDTSRRTATGRARNIKPPQLRRSAKVMMAFPRNLPTRINP